MSAPDRNLMVDALLEDEEQVQPRFAEHRLAAARRAGLPQRLLLNRARTEGNGYRRAESAEQERLED